MRFPRRALALGTVALLAVPLAACGSSDHAAPTTVPLSVTPSASASAAAPAVPAGVPTQLPPAPSGAARTQESANAFATYVAMLDYRVIYTRDASPLFALVPPGSRCSACEKVRQAMSDAQQKVFGVPQRDPKILGVVPRSTKGDEYVVGVAFETAPVKVLDASGKGLGTLKAYPDNFTEVHMKWDDASAGWRLLDFQAQIGDDAS